MLSNISNFILENILEMIKKAKKRDIVNVVEVDSKKADYTSRLRVGDVKIESSNINICYLIFHFQKIKKDLKLTFEQILILIYLYELGLFSRYVDIDNKFKKDILEFKDLGFVKEQFVGDKRYYSLSDNGLYLIRDLFNDINNSSKHKGKNRKAELDLENKVDIVLNNYFDRKS